MKGLSMNDLTFTDESSELVTIPRDEYEHLKKSQYVDLPHLASQNEIYGLDYEIPKEVIRVKIPKWSQIQDSIQVLQAAAPNTVNANLIRWIYSKIYEKLPAQADTSNFYINTQANMQENNVLSFDEDYDLQEERKTEDQRVEHTQKFSGIINQNQKNNKDKGEADIGQPSVTQNDKLKREQIMVKTFCLKGYDLKAFAEELAAHNLDIDAALDENPYDFIRKVLSSAFYKIQSFIKEDQKCHSATLSEEVALQQIVSSMMFCHSRYSSQCCNTLFNVIKGLCRMEHQDITDIQSLKLYEEIGKDVSQTQIKRQAEVKKQSAACQSNSILGGVDLDLDNVRKYSITTSEDQTTRYRIPKVPRESHQKPTPRKTKNFQTQCESVQKLNSIWNSKLEHDLIYHYKKGKNISDIMAIFRHQYPKQSDHFSGVALRSTLHKILRQGIKKLINVISRYGSQDLPKLQLYGSKEIRYITSNNGGLQARYHILDIFQLVKYDEKIVTDTILEINKYLGEIRNQQIAIQQDSEEQISVPFKTMKKKAKPVLPEWQIKGDEEYKKIHMKGAKLRGSQGRAKR